MSMPFTKDDVITAYANLKEQGILPIQKQFKATNEEGKVCGACAITAVLFDRGLLNVENRFRAPYVDLLNIDRDVMWSFVEGFDAEPMGFTSIKSDAQAYELGVECRKAIFTV